MKRRFSIYTGKAAWAQASSTKNSIYSVSEDTKAREVSAQHFDCFGAPQRGGANCKREADI